MGAAEAALFCLLSSGALALGLGDANRLLCGLQLLLLLLGLGVGEDGERGRRDEGYLRWSEELQGVVRTNAICLNVLMGLLGKSAQGRRLFLNY